MEIPEEVTKWLAKPAANAAIGWDGIRLARAAPTTACVLRIIACLDVSIDLIKQSGSSVGRGPCLMFVPNSYINVLQSGTAQPGLTDLYG